MSQHFDLWVRGVTLIDGTRAPREAGDTGVRTGAPPRARRDPLPRFHLVLQSRFLRYP